MTLCKNRDSTLLWMTPCIRIRNRRMKMRFQKKKWMKKCPKLPVCRCNHRVRPCVPICTAGWNKQPSALFRTVSGEFPRARNGRLSGRSAGSKSIAGERRTSKFDARQIHQPAVRAERRSEVASKQRIPGLSDIKILEYCLCTGK